MTPVIAIERDEGAGDRNPTFLIDGSMWFIEWQGLENFDGVPYSVSTDPYAQYDGSRLKRERSGEVDRTIVAHSCPWYDPASARSEAESFFLPGYRYLVHVSMGGRERYCEGRQYALKIEVPAGLQETQRITWTVLCLDPFFMSEDEKSVDLAEASKRRGFPFVSFAERVAPKPDALRAKAERHVAGFVVGVIQNRVSMRNDGHAVAYPRFDVSASGTVVNPSIKVLDSSGIVVGSVGLDLSLSDGDRLVIDFTTRPTAITLNGRNASAKVTRGSTLATGIPVGPFTVEWSAASGDAALSVVPSIRERYTCI